MLQKALLALAGLGLSGGCSGAVHQLPALDQSSLRMAQTEVAATEGPLARRIMSYDDVRTVLQSALTRIRPAAATLCHEVAVGTCAWRFVVLNDHSMNASAGLNGVIVVNRGIVEYAENEEQVAMVIAHEIAHQIADHVETGQRNRRIGAAIGALLVGAAAAATAYRNPYYNPNVTRDAMQGAAGIGAYIGGISFSKEQEREADYLAAVILYRSGVDLDKARGFLVIMARSSGKKETGMLDTHPAEPERVAAWDKNVQEIRASNGALPKRK